MEIKYTNHALKKFSDLRLLGFKVTRSDITQVLTNPFHIDTLTDYPNKLISGKIDATHILRVVCRQEHDIIVVITFYPAKKGRYFS